MQGNKLFNLKNRHLTIHKSFKAEDKDGKDIFEVKGHFSLGGSRSTCHFLNKVDGREIELEIKGGEFFSSSIVYFLSSLCVLSVRSEYA